MAGKKSMKPGGGGRFQKLERHLASEGVHNPKAAAAAIGREKYGAKKMGHFSAEGRARSARKRG